MLSRRRSPHIARTTLPGAMTTESGSGGGSTWAPPNQGADYAEANNMRAECNGLVREVFKEIDLMACTSTLGPAHPVTPEMMYGPMDREVGTPFQRFTIPHDFNGVPTLTVPCGLSSDGLPLSLQIRGQASVRAAAVQGRLRLRAGDRVAQPDDLRSRDERSCALTTMLPCCHCSGCSEVMIGGLEHARSHA